MKLLSLNIWRGIKFTILESVLRQYAGVVDVFCFQEIYNGNVQIPNAKNVTTDSFLRIQNILADYTGYHAESGLYNIEGTEVSYGIAMFVRKDLEIQDYRVYEIFKFDENIELGPGMEIWNRLLQCVTVPVRNSPVTIFNLHGLYTGGGKGDGSARLLQSERVKKFMENHAGEKILCGDFNLNSDTESLRILADGMKNLIADNNITTTRSNLYPRKQEMPMADYMLVTPGISVKSFEVPYTEASDHLPMMLDFD